MGDYFVRTKAALSGRVTYQMWFGTTDPTQRLEQRSSIVASHLVTEEIKKEYYDYFRTIEVQNNEIHKFNQEAAFLRQPKKDYLYPLSFSEWMDEIKWPYKERD